MSVRHSIACHHIIKSLRTQENEKRRPTEKLADWLTETFGSVAFVVFHVIWFGLWILANMGYIPGVAVFDPYPYGLLTMVVSLEAIFLSTFVLISQNRAAKVDVLRDEIDLHVDTITEQEISKLMKMVALLMKKEGIHVDKEASEMMKPTDLSKVQKIFEKEAGE